MPTKAIALTVLFCLGVLVHAQEQKKISLQEALVTAVERNLDIQLQRINLETSSLSLDETRVKYEPVVNSNLSSFNFKQEASSLIQGDSGSTFTTEGIDWNTTLSKAQDWGMDWRLQFNNGTSEDDSAFSLPGKNFSSRLSFSFTQQLLKGFSLDPEVLRNDQYVARGNIAIAESDYRTNVLTILETTEFAYWDLVYAMEDLKVKQQSLRLAQQLYDQNKIKIEVGTLASIDLVQTESQIAQRESDIVTAENQVRAAGDRLKLALNLPVDDWTKDIIPTESFEINEQKVALSSDLETALTNRPEMQKNRLQVENALLTLKLRKNELKPELSFNGTYQSDGRSAPLSLEEDGITLDASYQTALNKVLFTELPGWSISLDLNWRPFNKQGKIAMSRANAELRRVELEAERTKLNILNDVRTASRELQANWESIKANDKNVKFQRENVKAENQKFQNGLSTNYEVSQAQNDLASAESQLLSSRINYLKALVGYHKALGQLLDKRKIAID